MKRSKIWLFIAGMIVLIIPLVSAGAPIGTFGDQAFWGDGAVNDGTGGWTWPAFTFSGSGACLECHNGGINPFSGMAVPDKTSYLKTGHKNMLRKVIPGMPWKGADGAVYEKDASGNTFDWTNGTITVNGVTKVLFYVFGDWMAPEPYTLFDKNGDGTTVIQNLGIPYSCASCHTTGYADSGRPEPAATYPGVTGGITGTWVADGIQCERCHDATEHHEAPRHTATVPKGTDATALCSQCHLVMLSGQTEAANAIQVGANHGATFGKEFNGHIIGKEFLNSVHARFNGTPNEIPRFGNYDSYFLFDGAGCAACHDVHKSTIEAAGQTGAVRECVECHVGKYAKTLGFHTGLPDNLFAQTCPTCHMPKPSAADTNMHIWRINSDPDYSTFPSAEEFESAGSCATAKGEALAAVTNRTACLPGTCSVTTALTVPLVTPAAGNGRRHRPTHGQSWPWLKRHQKITRPSGRSSLRFTITLSGST